MKPDLRARREALGLDLARLADETRIPIGHLRAIEEGRLEDLPAGPYREGWVRAYRERLGVDDAPSMAQVPPPAALPLDAARWAAVASVLGLVLLAGWSLMDRTGGAVPVGVPDQLVTVEARVNTQVRVEVDGLLVHDGVLTRGERVEASGRDEVVVELPAVGNVRLTYQGKRVEPQGNQDMPRRLVFVDDGEGG